ncbi:MAG: hypothetical protein NWE95_07060 [Candidatus Bathyarchaeota archaeon]|nr:hypothetical protein [Candidatus Bathyarchaeota archaeon]
MTNSPIITDTFSNLMSSCISFYEKNKTEANIERIREKRAKLSVFAEAFHKDAGTLTASVQKKLADLKNGNSIVLMTAHQPNFFAYSGVLRKATLNFVLAKKLEELLEIPVVNFFGIADQDFTDDRWVRSCHLPAVQRNIGVLSIEVKLPEKLLLNKVAKPSRDLLEKWRTAVEVWLYETVSSVRRLCVKEGFSTSSIVTSLSDLHKNFNFVWNVVEACHERSNRYSDFNAFLMSKIVNDVWGYDTVFSRFSDCQQIFADEFSFLLSRFMDYSRLLNEAQQIQQCGSESSGMSDQEPLMLPFWYHCDCGSKAKLFYREKNGSLFGEGNCVGCGKYYELTLGAESDLNASGVASRISARAIPMLLVFFNGLMPSCYVGGVGGIRYLIKARHVSGGLEIPFPPVAVWRPRDKYLGVGQLEAKLELMRICKSLGAQNLSEAKKILGLRITAIRKRIRKFGRVKEKLAEELRENPHNEELKERLKEALMNQTNFLRNSKLSVFSRELKLLENVSTILDLIPSILDYSVNIGLKETSDYWIWHLDKHGSLSTDVYLDSVLSQHMKLDKTLPRGVLSE